MIIHVTIVSVLAMFIVYDVPIPIVYNLYIIGSYDNWLEPERPVLDPAQDLPKPPHPLVLNLAIM